MPLLPVADCNLPAPPIPGCDWLFETATALLGKCAEGLEPYQPEPEDACDRFDTYVTMGAPVGEFRYDGLAIYLMDYGPDNESVARLARTSGNPPGVYAVFAARWQFQLWENGWPQVEKEGEYLTTPDPQKLHAAAEHVYAHGIAAYNKLAAAIPKGSIGLPSRVDKVTLGPMTPLAPQGGAVGWAWQVTTAIA